MDDSRRREIEQGLRHESGCLTFPLVAEEYGEGFSDFSAGKPVPRITSASYDLGRALGQRKAEEAAQTRALLDRLDAESRKRTEVVREMLRDRPDVLASFDADMARLSNAKSPPPP